MILGIGRTQIRTTRPTPSSAGFTLIEVTVTLVLLVLAVGVVIPSFGALGAAELRSEAGKLAGTLRASFDSAALTGRTYRVTFSFEKPLVKVEATESVAHLDQESNALVAGAQAATVTGDSPLFSLLGAPGDLPDSLDEGGVLPPPDALQALLASGQRDLGGDPTSFEATEHSFTLGKGVRVLDLWTEGSDELATEGEVAIYFFPGGYTQETLIHLEDSGGHVYSVKLRALTGRTQVIAEYVEVPRS